MKQSLLLLLLSLSLFTHAQTKNKYYEKAIEYREKSDYNNALRQIDLALASDSNNIDFLFFKANSLYETKEFQPAFELYSKIIRLYPNDAIALNQRGLLLSSLQEFEYSIRDFDKALSLKNIDSLRLSLLVNRGAAKLAIRNFQGAYDDFMTAHKIDSLEIGTLNNLATVCDEVGKGEETLKYLYRIIEIDSNFIGAYSNIGFKYQQMGEYKKSIGFFDKVLKLDPNEALAYNNRGYSRLKSGDLAGALTDVEKSISLYPGNSYAFRNRALIYIELKEREKACKDLEKAINMGFTKMYGDEVEKLRLKHCQTGRL